MVLNHVPCNTWNSSIVNQAMSKTVQYQLSCNDFKWEKKEDPIMINNNSNYINVNTLLHKYY